MEPYLRFLLSVAETDTEGDTFPWIEAEIRECGYASGPWKHSPGTPRVLKNVMHINDAKGLVRSIRSTYSVSQSGGAKYSLPSVHGHQH